MYNQIDKICGQYSDVGKCTSRSVTTPIRAYSLKNGAVLMINIRITAWDVQATVSYDGVAATPVMSKALKEEEVYWLSLPSWPENIQYGSYNQNQSKFSCIFYIRDENDMASEFLPFILSLIDEPARMNIIEGKNES